jgi:hypothetical protein
MISRPVQRNGQEISMKRATLSLLLLVLSACARTSVPAPAVTPANLSKMNDTAERYVKIVLALGQHDPDYVDAFYGPADWRKEAEVEKATLGQIEARALAVQHDLSSIDPGSDPIIRLRHTYLSRQIEAVLFRIQMLNGKKFTFDEESKGLYDAVAPHHDEAFFSGIRQKLEAELPGEGDLAERIDHFRSSFIIPKEKLDTVFQAALRGCREHTLQHLTLPPEESFRIEYVTNKSWGGYNWYQGGFKSLIQVNTDLPIHIDRAIDLACHEGYPGHHVYNVLLEKNLVRGRNWLEFTVYPLFSPQSLIAEGSANFGIDVTFPGAERTKYEREVLFPLAGLDASQADKYYRVLDLLDRLSYAGNEAARRYLDGEITGDQAVEWMVKYQLSARDRARQRLKFIDQYRSYVINYNLGKDLVRQYVEANGGTIDHPQRRWQVFTDLLSSPRLPSGLSGGR